MKQLLIIFFILLYSQTVEGKVEERKKASGVTYLHGEMLNYEIEIGCNPSFPLHGMLGGKLGMMYLREPWFFSTSLSGKIFNDLPAVFGPEIEIMHLYTGLWSQFFLGFVAPKHQQKIAFAAGMSLFGLEYQIEKNNRMLLVKLRIPLSLLLFAGFR
jgi:hypothetical protein